MGASEISDLESVNVGISSNQIHGIQQTLADALKNAYGKNKWACVMIFAAFVCGIDNYNLKKHCVKCLLCNVQVVFVHLL